MSEASGGGPGNTPGPSDGAGNVRNNNNNHNNRPNNRNHRNNQSSSRFEGTIEELKGYVYDISGARNGTSPDSFQKTTNQIALYLANKNDKAGPLIAAFQPDVLKLPALVEPPVPDDAATNVAALKLWELDVKEYRENVKHRTQYLQQAYAAILSQCSPALRDRLESSPRWGTVSASVDGIELLKLIQHSTHTGSTTKHEVLSYQEAEDRFKNFRQNKLSDHDYYERFRERLAVFEYSGGVIEFSDELLRARYLVAQDPPKPTDQEFEAARAKAKEQYLAIRFLRNSRYAKMVAGLHNKHSEFKVAGIQVNVYPNTLHGAYKLILNHRDPERNLANDDPRSGMGFAQEAEDGHSRGGRGNGRNTGRGGRGHGGAGRGGQGASSNTDGTNTGSNSTTTNTTSSTVNPYLRAEILSQQQGGIPDNWILLDSCSSVCIIRNESLLRDIFKVDRPLHLHCNAGTICVNQKGYFGDYPEPVWFNPAGIANILSLDEVSDHYRVTMDTDRSKSMTLHLTNGDSYVFTPSVKGLYRYPLPDISSGHTMWTLINTVSDNMQNYTKRDVEAARVAREMQTIMMNPTDSTLSKTAITYLKHCPVTAGDIARATDIFGPNVESLKGKTTARPSVPVPSGVDPVPSEVLSRHRDVTIAIDIMFVNKVPFLVTLSRGIRFVTAEWLPNRQVSTVRAKLKSVLKKYRHRGFNVVSILGDPEFDALKPYFPQLTTCAAGEHVPEVERMIRTIKERARSTYSRLPFRRIPRSIINHLVMNAVLWLNALPSPDSVSPSHLARYLLTGRDLTYDRHVRSGASFGSYVQTHEQHDNGMSARTLGAISLGPTGNAQGGHYFYHLSSGDVCIRSHWTPLPMPQEAIDRVNAIGRRQGMPSSVTFSNRYGEEIRDTLDDIHADAHNDADDPTYVPYADDDDDGYDSFDPDDYVSDDDDADDLAADADPVDYDTFDDGDLLDANHNDLADDADAGACSDPDSDDDADADGDMPPRPVNAAADPLAAMPGADNPGDDEMDPIVEEDAPFLQPRRVAVTPGAQSPSSSSTSTGVNRATTRSRNFYAPLAEDSDDDEPPPLVRRQLDYDSSDDEDSDEEDDTANEEEPAESPGVQSPGVQSPGVQMPEAPPSPKIQRRTVYEQFQDAAERGRRNASNGASTGRPQREKKPKIEDGYTYLTALVDAFSPNDHEELFSLVTAQMTANKGIKVFGEKGENAIAQELQQLLVRQVMHGVSAESLTPLQKRAALRYLMFLKEKRCGKIKARGCADGRKQRIYKTKAETSSPTVSNEALFLSCLIDAHEGRKVITCDIPGAFMQAEIDELVHVRLDGAILDVLLRIDPSYEQYVVYEHGKKVLYTELDMALYGTVQASLLFWKKLSAYLVDELGFTVNPYDFCIANKTINGKQCTIAWYVHDLKLSHVEQDVIESVLAKLNEKFGELTPLTVTRGDVHDYLGMQIDYSTPGKVKFTMPVLTEEVLKQMTADMHNGPSSTPASNQLFRIRVDAKKLDDEQKDLFHRVTAQLLYMSKRARPDLQTCVAFLTTRVRAPDIDDWRKLARALRYLKRTRNMPLILEANSLSVIHWWVDASYGVHPDLKSHTGATMSVGKGSVMSMSTRQKINTRSSTEAELVGVNDGMSLILWTRNFLEAQGYKITNNVIFQDNESAILLEKNGRHSSSKRTRHLDIRYFFVTDNLQRKRVEVKYCPTGDMVADFFTKPLQGSTFRKLLKLVMNIDDDMIEASSQECVVNTTVAESRAPGTHRDRSTRLFNNIEVTKIISCHDSNWMTKPLLPYVDRSQKKE